ncbi:hypothetical protein KY284_016509 [Solanum tuberosum]|nr:hypothetical protein KY284_016509 [Solanum tuberosum]
MHASLLLESYDLERRWTAGILSSSAEKWKWAGLFGLGRDNGCVLQLRAARWAGTLNSLEWAEKLQGKSQSWSLEGVKTNC